MKNIPEIVHNAALYLDEWYPGWEEKLDGVDFDISNMGNCILHHVTGSYYTALDAYKSRVSQDIWNKGSFPFASINLDKVGTHTAWRNEIYGRLNKLRVKTEQRELVTA
jgi:hypothetical protein